MKKTISILIGFAVALSNIVPIFAQDNAVEPLRLEDCKAIRNSATLFFNKEVDMENLDFTLVADDDPSTEMETEVLSEDNKAITVKFSGNLAEHTEYTLSSPLVADADKKSILLDVSMKITVSNVLYSDDFEDCSSVEDFAAKYRYKRNDGVPVSLSEYPTTFAIETQESGNKRLAINKCDSYRRLMPIVQDESIFKDYIAEYTVANGQSAQHGMVAYQGNAAYDSNALTVTSTSANGIGVRYGSSVLQNVAKITTNNDTTLTFDMRGGKTDGKLSLYIDGVSKLKDLDVAYAANYGLFGIYMVNGAAPLYVDNIYAYQIESSYTCGDNIELKSLTPVLACDEYAAGKNVVCSIPDEEMTAGVDLLYDWYVSKAENEYPQSDDEWDIAAENSESNIYVIENDNKYIKCVVKQALSGIVFNEYPSPVLFKAMAPFINVKDGKPVAELVNKDNKLVVSYEYVDANADKELGTTIEWFTSTDTSENKNWELKKTAVINADDENKDYEFDVTGMTDTYVKCVITVRSEHEEDAETADYTGTPVNVNYTLPFKPVAKDVKITGNAEKGDILKVSYTYYDENGDEENKEKTAIVWYRINGRAESQIGTGVAYAVSSSDAGFSIRCEVTPANNTEPSTGDTVSSTAVSVKKTGTSSSTSSSSSSSSGMSSSSMDRDSQAALIGNPYAYNNTFVSMPEEKELSFTDTKGHWASDYIEELYAKGLVNGRDGGKFEPDAPITRAEWLSLLMRGAQIDTSNVKWQNCFFDVDKNEWYALDIQAAFDLGLVSGDDDGSFAPDEYITREAMAKMLVDVYEYIIGEETDDSTARSFNDAGAISDWAEAYIKKASAAGLINGDDENRFNPKNNTTRAEAAAVLSRMLSMTEEE